MKTVIESIKYNDGKFPRKQLEQIIERKEEAIPELLFIVREVKENPDVFLEDHESRMDFHYAIHLLSQFRVKEFFPLWIDILSLPEQLSDAVLGDIITEAGGRMIASVFKGDLGSIQTLIENTQLSEFVRGQGLHALVILALHGLLERKFVINYFKTLLTEKLSEEHDGFNAHLVNSCVDLYPQETYEFIEAAIEKEMVDFMMISMEDVDQTLAMPKETIFEENLTDIHYQLINDTITEMQWWTCFEEGKKEEEISPFAFDSKFSNSEPNLK
ncbi:DUF1186 domain-containing protein [Chengkuizengella axinellae]|uniref:DUF1186 domain-containing protein n=1 Tax=Chengkuizengella axinellae TaxID=3064388 RepID=A0ABT9J492_9BACL|nr:DUF1186 domain-containing protein [Chengkuizengella sp. 2205SS18-9]MDP5276447.1 DUF1186 domain-containing protein [Chengkuizengella sp. 2205SS18-9]